MRYRYSRALLAFMGVLFLFLVIQDLAVLSHQRGLLMDMTREHSAQELKLLGTVSEEALLKHDYAAVKAFLEQWAAEHPEVAAIRAVAPNGFVLAEYVKDVGPVRTFDLKHEVEFAGRPLITLEITGDYTPIRRELEQLNARLAAGSILLTVIMGVVLWYTQRRTAIKPLEKEIGRRLEAEEELRRARDSLEGQVQERTAELKKERDIAQSYLDIAGVIFLVLDNKGNIRLMNRMGCEILECAEEGVVGSNWFDTFVPERDRQVTKGVFLRLMEGQVDPVEYFENPVLTRSGEERLIAWHNTVLRDGKGRIYGTLSSGEDITERKRAEEALKASERSYRALAGNLPGIVYRTYLEGKEGMRFFNESVLPMTGYSPQELTEGGACSLERLIVPEDRARVAEAIKRAVQEDQPFQVEYQIRRKDGGVSYFFERGRPVRGAEGRPSHIDGVILDISQLKKAEEERKRLLSTLNTVLEHIPEGILLLDGSQRIIFVNPMGVGYLNVLTGLGAGERLTGISGRPLNDFLISPPHIIWHEVEVPGPPKYVFEVAGRNIIQDGAVTGMVLVIKDVTEEKEAAVRISSQERLAAVGHLASGIAHDFNNVLTGVIGYAEILQSDCSLSEHARQQAGAILQSGQRAADLVSQILDFSRKSTSELKVVDLRAFLNEFMMFLERLIPETIDMVFEAGPGTFRVEADVAKLQQVVANLAVNARDAMPRGGTLRVSLSRITQGERERPLIPGMLPGDWVVLSVRDTGTGIPPEAMPHIFEPFFTTKEPGRGTGLGLAQVYGIVRQHGGFVDVKTKFDKGGEDTGSTFVVCLPAAKAEAEAVTEKPEERPPRGEGETVLVVEDDPIVRDLIVKMLNTEGYLVLSAVNGEDALRVFEREGDRIRLCITDVVMPGIGGIELSRMLMERKPSIKVVAISGYPVGVDRSELESAGIVEWIQKPFQARAVREAVARALK